MTDSWADFRRPYTLVPPWLGALNELRELTPDGEKIRIRGDAKA
jgi:hypothetical protein